MQMTWQYKTIRHPINGLFKPDLNAQTLDDTLNRLGCAGWELVSAFDLNTGNGASIEVVLLLKRPGGAANDAACAPPPLPASGN